jgi:hypothetical protein
MNSVNISGLSVEMGIQKIKEQLSKDPDAVMVTTDSADFVKPIAKAIGSLGYRFEMWPAEGVLICVFTRLKL